MNTLPELDKVLPEWDKVLPEWVESNLDVVKEKILQTIENQSFRKFTY